MTGGKHFTVAVGALVGVFLAALLVALLLVRPANAVGSPSGSRLRLVEDLFPPRPLRAADIRRGGPTCLDGTTLVVAPGGGCTFIVPAVIHVVVFRRVPGSAGMTITLSQTGALTQIADTSQPGPDARDPLRLRFAVLRADTTVTLFSCRGPGSCRLDLSQ